uniref:T7SS effector LXG polymorphic toxin n=1 Tax=Fictibacillus gelatini TaxID=225985 RepID=UPI0009D66EC5
GQAIRLFYQECHLSFLLYFESFIKDYEAILTSIKNQLKNFEPDPNGFISESFLDHDVRAGLHKIETTTIGIVDEANKAMKEVRDIVDLPFLDETEVVENIWRAKRHAKTTIEQLHAFDKAQTAALETVEQDLALMANYINQISSAIKSGEVTISNYSVKQITSYETYNDLIGDLAQKTNPYENKYRRPDADEQLIASSYIAQLQNKNVTKEEFETLQEQKIKTVHVIDEYAEYDGDYHILANGMIVREYKDKNFNKQYQIVDKVPKNRAGGVRELDSPFEGTPLEIAEYAVPGGLIKKGVTKLGKKAITGIEKKVVKEYTKGIDKTVKPNDVVPYRPSNSPLENHHGVMDVWAKHNVPNYVSRGGNTPTVALTKEQHAATKAVYREWLYEKTGKKVGGKIDWQSVSPREIQELTERMFDAANVPKLARQEYYNSFNKYNYRE